MRRTRGVITGSICLLTLMALSACTSPSMHEESGTAERSTGPAVALPETDAHTPADLANDIARDTDAWSTALGGEIAVIAPQIDGSVLVGLVEAPDVEKSIDVGGIRVVVDQAGGSGGALALERQTTSAGDWDLGEIARELSSGKSEYLVRAGITDVQGVIMGDDPGKMTLISEALGDAGKFFVVGDQTVVEVEYGSFYFGFELPRSAIG